MYLGFPFQVHKFSLKIKKKKKKLLLKYRTIGTKELNKDNELETPFFTVKDVSKRCFEDQEHILIVSCQINDI